MANSHGRTVERKGNPTRRRCLQVGAAITGAVFGGIGATTTVGATPTVVDLGTQGLREGDEIDDYLEEHVADGTEVRIPAGRYDWNGEGFSGATEDAAIVGDGAVVLTNTVGEYYQTITADSGTVELRNLTFRGQATGEDARFRLRAEDDATVLVDGVNFPDGSEAGAKAKAFYVPREHAGTVEIHNSYVAQFDDNGIYANSPGYDDGEDGAVIVDGCVAHNNNISGIRVGSDGSEVRDCLVVNDEPAPESRNGTINQRGIRVRSDGEDVTIADCAIIHTVEGTGTPIQLHRGAEGGSGEISNVRIHNETDGTAIADQDDNTADNWEGRAIRVSGDGDSCPSHFAVETGGTEPAVDEFHNGASRWI